MGNVRLSCLVLVCRARKFYVGQFIKFCTLEDMDGIGRIRRPSWRRGKKTKIDMDRLYIDVL